LFYLPPNYQPGRGTHPVLHHLHGAMHNQWMDRKGLTGECANYQGQDSAEEHPHERHNDVTKGVVNETGHKRDSLAFDFGTFVDSLGARKPGWTEFSITLCGRF
jgi:hypothetical protein